MIDYLSNKITTDNSEGICRSCKTNKYLKKNKMPHCAVNGMEFHEKPGFLDLCELEKTQVAQDYLFSPLKPRELKRPLLLHFLPRTVYSYTSTPQMKRNVVFNDARNLLTYDNKTILHRILEEYGVSGY